MSQSGSRTGVMALVCLVAATAAAAQQPRPRFAVGLGLTAPTGDYHADQSGEGFKIGWQGVAVMDYRKPGSPLGFRANAGYGENGGNNQLNADLTALSRCSARMRTLRTT